MPRATEHRPGHPHELVSPTVLEDGREEPSSRLSADRAPVRSRIGRKGSLRFLLDAGQTLAGTLDDEKTLQALADLAVPRIACWCVVDIFGAGGRTRRVAAAHVDPAQLETLRHVTFFTPEPSRVVSRVLESSEPMLFSPIKDELLIETAAGNEEHLTLLRQLATTSVILVPLVARRSALGALVLASTRTERWYLPQDQDLARELGRIASLAIDNARLYREAQDALRARDVVLRVVAHDLRSPIGTVSMAASLLVEEGPQELRTGVLGRALDAIRSSISQANRLIDDLLDLARIESGRLTIDAAPVAPLPLVRGTVEMHRHAAAARGIDLQACTSDTLPHVLAEPERVLQALGNLLSNSIKFTPKGGRIDVCAEAAEDEVHVWVADTGPGIPPDQLPNVFDPYWQASRKDRRGLGLGLAIVHGIVEAHGGRTWAESTLGVGTRMHFTLPCAAP